MSRFVPSASRNFLKNSTFDGSFITVEVDSTLATSTAIRDEHWALASIEFSIVLQHNGKLDRRKCTVLFVPLKSLLGFRRCSRETYSGGAFHVVTLCSLL